MKKIVFTLLTLFFCLGFHQLEAQDKKEKKVEKKVVIVKKTVDADGNVVTETIEEGSGDENIFINREMDEDGNIEIEVISGEGKGSSKKGYITIDVEAENDGDVKKKIKIKVKDDDGNVKVMEWNGEGEMPEEMKKYMEDEDVEIHTNIVKDHKRIRIRSNQDIEGDEIEWDGEGDLPEDIRKKLKEEGIEIDGENVFIFKGDGDDDENVIIIKKGKGDKMEWISKNEENIEIHEGNHDKKMKKRGHKGDNKIVEVEEMEFSPEGKPRLGVMIENHVEGVEVLDIVEGSAAESAGIQKGDIIFKVGEKTVGSTLQLTAALEKVKEGKAVDIMLLRDGSKKTIKTKL